MKLHRSVSQGENSEAYLPHFRPKHNRWRHWGPRAAFAAAILSTHVMGQPTNPATTDTSSTGTGTPAATAGTASTAQPSAKASSPAAKEQTAASAPTGVKQLSTVVVSGSSVTPADDAAAQLATIPGGTSLANSSDYLLGRAATIGDILKYQPGVFAQSVSGGEATKYSIRGSGLVRTPYSWQTGVQLLVDGLPLTTSAGAPFETIEPLATDYVETYRGANAFNLGPLSLGGAINFVTFTGYDSSPAQAHVEFGSYGYEKEQISSGLVEGNFDYYFSATNYRFDGYRFGSVGDSKRLIFNLGYQVTPDLSTRIIVRYAQQSQGNAGYITQQQLQSAPSASQFKYITTRVNPGSTVASSITKLNVDKDSNLTLGFQYDDFPLRNVGGPTPSQDNWRDVSGSLVYDRHDIFFKDMQSDSEASVRFTDELEAPINSVATTGVTAHQSGAGYDLLFTGTNNLEVAKNLWLTTGVSSISQERDNHVTVAATHAEFGLDQHYYNLLGRGGLRYDLTPDISLFGNVSQSEEAPILPYLSRSNAQSLVTSVPSLKDQTAITGEFGIQGKEGPFTWSADYYRSWVQNELLTVLVAAPSTTSTSNAQHTIHQGVELSLDTTLWKSDPRVSKTKDDKEIQAPAADDDSDRDRVILRQSYTWSDFTYDNDPTFGNNSLPGVPENFYQAELRYQDASGFYAGINTESSISNYEADFANTIGVKPYAIFGATIGYVQPKKGFEVYFTAENIGNIAYAASISPTFNAHGADSSVYAPGLLQSFSGGVTYRF